MRNFSDKIKKIYGNIKEWASGKENFIKTGIVIIAIVIIVIIIKVSNKTVETATTAGAAAAITADTLEATDVPLEENAYEAVNALITQYYAALQSGDAEAVVALCSYIDDTEKIRIEKKSNYIESYENLSCFTKAGPVENSYIVYATYDAKFYNIDATAPSLNTLYVCPNEAGELYIYNWKLDETIADYVYQLSAQDDAVDLLQKVNVKYKEAIDSDESLNAFLTEWPTKLKEEVALALADAEAAKIATEEPVAEEVVEETPQEVVEEVAIVETVKTTTTVNVRSSDSETADKLGKADAGSTYTRLETLLNGWSKIDYNGTEAFIKTEFLEVVSTTTVEGDGTTTQTGKVVALETVNVRKEASETAEKLGVAAVGEEFELVEKRDDGWTKIIYDGQEAYVKSEYVN
ncbi:MAG: SH3 domain-containing protein [Clostridiales bacterium]|nr:SH3 domain-containing protein [Clostridiales bacterium]